MRARLRLTTLAVIGGLGAPGGAFAADAQIAVRVSSPVAWSGGTVTVRVTSTVPGIVNIAQSRRYVILTPGTGTCGAYDKYVSDGYGLHGPYLHDGAVPSAPDADPVHVDPQHPAVFRLPGSRLAFGAGDWPWQNTETWPGCKTSWRPYDRLGAWFSPDGSGLPADSYNGQVERFVRLQRVL